jgi:hypothetical protein
METGDTMTGKKQGGKEMTLTLEKGSQGRFIELEQDDVVKRFIVPDIEGLEGRIRSLVRKSANIALVRIGRAVVASKDETNGLRDGLEGIPSKVMSCYMIDMCGDHPMLGQGQARYSQELIQEIAKATPVAAQEERIEQGQLSVYDFSAPQEEAPSQVAALPTAPKKSLTDQLRAQKEQQEEKPVMTLEEALAKKKAEQPAVKSELEIVPSATTSAPSAGITLPKDVKIADDKPSKTQDDLNKAIEEARRKREARNTSYSQIKVMEPRPQGKIDILLEKVEKIESILTDGLTGDDVSGEDLAEWFYEHVETIGHEKTFAILASRLKN